MSTGWPICTHHVTPPQEFSPPHRNEHVGDEDYSEGSEAWKYVTSRGDATCSCCDPENGFACSFRGAEVER